MTKPGTTTGPVPTTRQPAKGATLCKRCGTPIPQQPGRGRPRLYCAEGDCAAQAKRQRELRRSTPGLEGALARAEELYEQIEQSMASALAPLAEALRAETDPAEVEARLAEVRSDAASSVAAARAERDEVGSRLVVLREELAAAQAEAERVAAALEGAEGRAKEAVSARLAAVRAAEAAREETSAAVAEAVAAVAGRKEAEGLALAAEEARAVAVSEREAAVAAREEAEQVAVAARGEAEAARVRADQVAAEAAEALRAGEAALERAEARALGFIGERDAERRRVESLVAEVAVARRDAEQASVRAAELGVDLERVRGELAGAVADARVSASHVEAAEAAGVQARAGLESWRERALAAEARLAERAGGKE
jgi:colicin import membrane protein